MIDASFGYGRNGGKVQHEFKIMETKQKELLRELSAAYETIEA